MPGRDAFGEISSASNCTDYQSRRLGIKYTPEAPLVSDPQPKNKNRPKPKPVFAHTLNATAIAVPRMIVALLENGQEADGSVTLPKVLRPFFGGKQSLTLSEK
jgi:seryl-tRNA synthetase